MEINFWRWLCNEDETGLLLKQRIPEVAIFRGCRLESWYHCASNNTVLRRCHDVSVQALCDRFMVLASPADFGLPSPEAPAAILRRSSGPRGHPELGCPASFPASTVLSVKELQDLLAKVESDVEKHSGSAEGDMDALWSLQAFVEPLYSMRVLSVYSCDAHLEETSDIFAKAFNKVYPMPGESSNVVPAPEDCESSAADVTDLVPSQRLAIESKTLGIVRFVRRFHNLELEGLLLEFIFDHTGRIVLHGCLCASLCSQQDLRRFRGSELFSRRPAASSELPRPPRAFAVPQVEAREQQTSGGRSEKQVEASYTLEPTNPDSESLVGNFSQVFVQPPRINVSTVAVEAPRDVPELLLELWRHEAFLGESLVPIPSWESASTPELRVLHLQPGGIQPPLRPDGRKLLADPAGPCGSAVVSLCIVPGVAGAAGPPLLQLRLGRAEDLPAGFPRIAANSEDEHKGVRALLWLREPNFKEFRPIWTSVEAEDVEEAVSGHWTNVALWGGECAEFAFPFAEPERNKSRDQEVSGRPSSKAPPTPHAPPAPPTPPATAHQKGKLRSIHDHVCGAELASHWGMSEEDGTMRGHVLAQQVLQRMSHGRMNRSGLLKQIANQLLSFQSLQEGWEAHLAESKQTLKGIALELQNQEQLLARRIRELEIVVEDHERKIASTCRRMIGEAEVMAAQESSDAAKLGESRGRVSEQRSALAALSERREQLQGSIERSNQKLEELWEKYVRVSAGFKVSQLDTSRSDEIELEAARVRAEELRQELAYDTLELAGANARYMKVLEMTNAERNHIQRLEVFIQKVAAQPAGTLRTGGGFVLDNLAKQEAEVLVTEFGMFTR